jgi:hypothetical protein
MRMGPTLFRGVRVPGLRELVLLVALVMLVDWNRGIGLAPWILVPLGVQEPTMFEPPPRFAWTVTLWLARL